MKFWFWYALGRGFLNRCSGRVPRPNDRVSSLISEPLSKHLLYQRGYRDGADLTTPEPLDDVAFGYRHGFWNGRSETLRRHHKSPEFRVPGIAIAAVCVLSAVGLLVALFAVYF